MSSAALQVNALKWLFSALGCLMLGTLIYTLYIDGLPFRKELLTPWMAATLVDFYIAIVALSAWVTYKVSTWTSAVLWIVLLVCFGSITTCTFILVQLFKFSYQDPIQDPMYFVLVRNGTERKRTFFSVTTARILFTALGLLQLGTLIYTLLTDGSPFRKELMTPWLTATLIDFYINIVAFSVWIIYKEAHLISALLWIVLLICLGSITTCAYIVVQLFQLSPQDPLYLVLLNSRSSVKWKRWTDQLKYNRAGFWRSILVCYQGKGNQLIVVFDFTQRTLCFARLYMLKASQIWNTSDLMCHFSAETISVCVYVFCRNCVGMLFGLGKFCSMFCTSADAFKLFLTPDILIFCSYTCGLCYTCFLSALVLRIYIKAQEVPLIQNIFGISCRWMFLLIW